MPFPQGFYLSELITLNITLNHSIRTTGSKLLSMLSPTALLPAPVVYKTHNPVQSLSLVISQTAVHSVQTIIFRGDTKL